MKITRYSVKDGSQNAERVVMKTGESLVNIEQGISTWRFDNANLNLLQSTNIATPHIIVDACWHDASSAIENNIRILNGDNANSFGSMGVLLVPADFNIPTVMATKQNVRFYGLQLIESGDELTIQSDSVDIVLRSCLYGSHYRREFLMQEKGGGGVFVETHNFPHVHIPLSPDCGGHIIIGKLLSEDRFAFTAFQIPYGYAFYTPPGTIHGDGTLVGEYGLVFADDCNASTDTVLIYNEKTMMMAQDVVPEWEGHVEF